MESDGRAIRIFVFPERPDALLVHVPEGKPLALPVLSTPFVKGEVSSACKLAGVDVRVRESTPGRWTPALERAKNDERGEIAQRQRLREATEAKILADTGDPIFKDRAEVLRRKHLVDEEIGRLKTQIGDAKASVRARGVYMDPHAYRRLEAKLAGLKVESQALQARLGELREAEKERDRAAHDAERSTFLGRFVEAAREMLDPETFAEIVAAANEAADGDDEEDADAA
jgi:hypothetical protein